MEIYEKKEEKRIKSVSEKAQKSTSDNEERGDNFTATTPVIWPNNENECILTETKEEEDVEMDDDEESDKKK